MIPLSVIKFSLWKTFELDHGLTLPLSACGIYAAFDIYGVPRMCPFFFNCYDYFRSCSILSVYLFFVRL